MQGVFLVDYHYDHVCYYCNEGGSLVKKVVAIAGETGDIPRRRTVHLSCHRLRLTGPVVLSASLFGLSLIFVFTGSVSLGLTIGGVGFIPWSWWMYNGMCDFDRFHGRTFPIGSL